MFDELMQVEVFGSQITYKGEEYYILQHLKSSYYLTVKVESKNPAQVYLLQIEGNKNENI